MEFLRLAFLDYLEHRYDDDDSIKLMKPIQQTNQTIIECRRYRLVCEIGKNLKILLIKSDL